MVRAASSVHGIDVGRIEAAIEAAERRTSAELRVAIARFYFWGDVRRAAASTFRRLDMQRTRKRNAVLIFIAPRRRRFAVIADDGIPAHVSPAFWNDVASKLRTAFATSDATGGLERAITAIGDTLSAPFPPESSNRNELPNQVVR